MYNFTILSIISFINKTSQITPTHHSFHFLHNCLWGPHSRLPPHLNTSRNISLPWQAQFCRLIARFCCFRPFVIPLLCFLYGKRFLSVVFLTLLHITHRFFCLVCVSTSPSNSPSTDLSLLPFAPNQKKKKSPASICFSTNFGVLSSGTNYFENQTWPMQGGLEFYNLWDQLWTWCLLL